MEQSSTPQYKGCPTIKDWETITYQDGIFNMNSWLQHIWTLWDNWDLTKKQRTSFIDWMIFNQNSNSLERIIIYSEAIKIRNDRMKEILKYLWISELTYLDDIDGFTNLLIDRWYLEADKVENMSEEKFSDRLKFWSNFRVFLEILARLKNGYEDTRAIIHNEISFVRKFFRIWLISEQWTNKLIWFLHEWDFAWYKSELLKSNAILWDIYRQALLREAPTNWMHN